MGLYKIKQKGYMKVKDAKKIKLNSKVASGWARPKNFLYIYHHPQPPSKYIGYSEICQEVYLFKLG